MREYLEKYRYINKKIEICKNEIEQIKPLIDGIKGIRYDIDKIQKTKSIDAPFAKYVIRLVNLENEIHVELGELLDIREELKREIYLLPDKREQLLLHYRYIEGLSWSKIALEFNVNVRTVLRWHREILKKIKKCH